MHTEICIFFSRSISRREREREGEESMEASTKNAMRFSGLGGSLPVPNVQALAATDTMKEIMQRYIRPEIEDEVVLDADNHEGIPIVDLSQLVDPGEPVNELIKFKLACREWGFFQLINHGVPDEVIQQMKSDLKAFFNLPLEEKQKVAQLPNSIEGYGQAFVVSEDQLLDWGDMFFLETQPVNSRNMKLWPDQPLTFRNTLDNYSSELKRVSDCLLELMAKDLGLPPRTLGDMFLPGRQTIRMNYYPACPDADKVLGNSPHSDPGGLTILLQVNPVNGLQIRRDGRWIPIEPVPDAFVVNIGDILEVMTNGIYKSIEHRVMVNTEKERLSIAAFHSPNINLDIGPLEELVKGSKKCYKTSNYLDFLKLVVSSKPNGKGLLNQMKLDNK